MMSQRTRHLALKLTPASPPSTPLSEVRMVTRTGLRTLRAEVLVVPNQLSSHDTVNCMVTSRESPGDMVAGGDVKVHTGYQSTAH
jgi:hypothetical protein